MPAVTLQNSTVQSSQNCGVLIALAADTSLSVDHRLLPSTGGGVEALGLPAGGGHPDVGDADHHDQRSR